MEMSLTGYLMPAHSNRQPVLIGMAGTNDLFIVVFPDPEKLRDFMAQVNVGFDRIQVITDGSDFIESIEEANAKDGRNYKLRIAANPYKHENGNWRFTEIFGEGN